MTWLDLVGDSALRHIFASAPDLQNVRVHEVSLHQDGPRLTVRFDLNEYPPEPPSKWAAAGHNTVQVTLVLLGIRRLAIRGWGKDNIGDIQLSQNGDGTVELRFVSRAGEVTGAFDHAVVGSVAAYCNAKRG